MSGNNDVSVAPDTVTFTTTDWNSPKTFTVSAQRDDDASHGQATISHVASGSDYSGVRVDEVAVTVRDDDTRGVTISATTVTLREGGQISYTVVLDTRPTGRVTVRPSEPVNDFETSTVSIY